MRITHDRETDSAYIYLTDEALTPGRRSVPLEPPDAPTLVVLDFKDERLVGLEVHGASRHLPADVLATAVDED